MVKVEQVHVVDDEFVRVVVVPVSMRALACAEPRGFVIVGASAPSDDKEGLTLFVRI